VYGVFFIVLSCIFNTILCNVNYIYSVICSNLQGLDLVIEIISLIGLFVVLFILVPLAIYILFALFIALIAAEDRDNLRARRDIGALGRATVRLDNANRRAARSVGRFVVRIARRIIDRIRRRG